VTRSFDENIFDEFAKVIENKKILSGDALNEFNMFFNKPKISEEDWGLLIDKECFPSKKKKDEYKEN